MFHDKATTPELESVFSMICLTSEEASKQLDLLKKTLNNMEHSRERLVDLLNK